MEDEAIVIGVDAHKRTHTLVASDAVGRRLAEATVEATTDGHLVALEWACRWPVRKWISASVLWRVCRDTRFRHWKRSFGLAGGVWGCWRATRSWL